jgi:hypothetical protein
MIGPPEIPSPVNVGNILLDVTSDLFSHPVSPPSRQSKFCARAGCEWETNHSSFRGQEGILPKSHNLSSQKKIVSLRSGEQARAYADLQFGTVEEALRAGVEFAIEWIEVISWII